MDTVIAQREIEFRAWDTITNEMVFSTLVRNNYLAINLNGNVLGYEDTDKDQEVLFYPERFIITQYTGLKDKHGNKIFEGDILKAFTRSFTGKISKISEHNALCFWNVSSFNFRLLPVSDNFGRCVNNYSHGFEIIGNVFDNPELSGEAND